MTLLVDRIRIQQEREIRREARAPLNITREQWLHGKWPEKSKWYGTLGEAYGPPGSAIEPDRRTGSE